MNHIVPEDAVFISWIAHHGRSKGIADALGIKCAFIDGGDGLLPLRYWRQLRATRSIMNEQQPKVVFVMQPPSVALAAVRLSKYGRRARIVSDMHTGAFLDPKWKPFLRAALAMTGRDGLVLVTNSALSEVVTKLGYRCLELHDRVDDPLIQHADPHQTPHGGRRTILVPLAYARDEPLSEILLAAELDPSTDWRLTGNAPQWMHDSAPPNVHFTGFLSLDDYLLEVAQADAMAALTTEEHTMQRAGYEALSHGKALLTSRMVVLQEFFDDAAVYAEMTADGISKGAQHVLDNRNFFEARMRLLKLKRAKLQAEQLRTVARVVFEETK